MTTADFIDVGTSLDLSEALMMSVIVGSSSFLASLMIQVGIGSSVKKTHLGKFCKIISCY